MNSTNTDATQRNSNGGFTSDSSIQYETHELDEQYKIMEMPLPEKLRFDDEQFDHLWFQQPEEYHEILMFGRKTKVARKQQAYGKDYQYSGNTNRALPIPNELKPLHDWCKSAIDPRLNGLLLNWYDGSLGHRITAHRDERKGLVDGSPIVTVSLGEERIFRVRPQKGKGCHDFVLADSAVVIMPYETNIAFTHEVPHFKRYRGRRISITLRAFDK